MAPSLGKLFNFVASMLLDVRNEARSMVRIGITESILHHVTLSHEQVGELTLLVESTPIGSNVATSYFD